MRLITRVRIGGCVTASLCVLALSPAAAQQDPAVSPSVGGAFSEPFVEDPGQPRCEENEDGYIVCKPVAVSMVALRDGRTLFWNGLEGFENINLNTTGEASEASRNSRARLLDLRSGTPVYSSPTPEDGAVGGEQKRVDHEQAGPTGALGMPGKPGDGLVGSTVGQVAPGSSSAPPDDPEANDRDMFCAYQVHLADGRVLIMGGTDWYMEPNLPGEYGVTELDGLEEARLFDPATDAFTQTGSMKYARWYPSAVTLPDGKVFVASGVVKLIKNGQLSNVRRTETFDPANGQWTENYVGMESEATLPLYPRMRLMPNGKVLFAAAGQTWNPFGQAADEALWNLQRFFNTETKTWETVGPAPLGFRGSPVDVLLPLTPPYDKATVLQAGGVLGTSPGSYLAAPFTTETTVAEDGTVTSKRTGNLHNARWFGSGVNLPDGTVLALAGGNRDAVVFPGTEEPIQQVEIYDPKTGQWTAGATATRPRVYHNTATLLPDARVLLGGHSTFSELYGGADFDTVPDKKDPTFEVYSPPYLFRGERPVITRVQSGIAWGDTFGVTVSSPTPIESVMLVRLGATTHVVDNDLRALFLEFTQQGSELSVTAPPDGVAAPPGPYYLFVNRTSPDGPIPSVAGVLTLGATESAAPATIPFPAQPGAAETGQVSAPPAPRASGQLPATGGGVYPLAAVATAAGVTLLALRRRRR